ncbi:MAG: DUF5694 domain-containing protein [Pseudomonadota bacterium]
MLIRIILPLVLLSISTTSAYAQSYRPAFQPDEMRPYSTDPPNTVVVLGTPHLRDLPESFDPKTLEPLVRELIDWKPTAVAVEDHSGLLCDTMRRQAERHGAAFKKWCDFDPAPFNRSTGYDVTAANDEVEKRLANWAGSPAPSMRRELAALFLAAGENISALVQWLRLPTQERRPDGMLTAKMAAYLAELATVKGENQLISARVAAAAGLERVYGVDDQAFYVGAEPVDQNAYEAAIMAAWDNPAAKARRQIEEGLIANLAQPDGILEIYRTYNSPSWVEIVYASDFGAALKDNSDKAYGRRYISYWETRNIRMVANIREALGRKAGTRMLAVVGASHKPYYEAYLAQMHDVELADPMLVLP